MDIERIRAFAVFDLGLTNEQFWDSTHRQTAYLTDRYNERRKQEDRRAGGIIAMLYNINRDSTKDPEGLDWDDFFTEWKPPQPEQTEEEMFNTMMLLAKATQEFPA